MTALQVASHLDQAVATGKLSAVVAAHGRLESAYEQEKTHAAASSQQVQSLNAALARDQEILQVRHCPHTSNFSWFRVGCFRFIVLSIVLILVLISSGLVGSRLYGYMVVSLSIVLTLIKHHFLCLSLSYSVCKKT